VGLARRRALAVGDLDTRRIMSNDAHPAGAQPADADPGGAHSVGAHHAGAHPLRTGAMDTGAIDYVAVEDSPRFRELKREHRSFVFPVAIGFLVWYFAYVLLADYAHEFMATPVLGNVNAGILLGLGQFVTTFAITTWYVHRANARFDPIAAEIRADLEGREQRAGREGRA
jgi:uncharacterized membrane protein (DUF485 family)